MAPASRYDFIPERYEQALTRIFTDLLSLPAIDDRALSLVLKRYPKDGHATFSKSELVRGLRFLEAERAFTPPPGFAEKLRTKPIRTESGVAPVTVLTKPFPCPGECIFCPSDVRMPKSYLSMEPGAQRAAQHAFDPYGQTFTRLRAFHNNGHKIDKVELIVLGGSWSFYPEAYQIWFVKRCFDALNDFFEEAGTAWTFHPHDAYAPNEQVDGRILDRRYNEVISKYLRVREDTSPEEATWEALAQAHEKNESSRARCVGLSLETRPDLVTEGEVVRLRRLGATKIQLGIQSLDDEVLRVNKRGHDVEASRRAIARLRLAGFKVHAHWMPNLLGATAERDLLDLERLFADPALRPDELKIYPTSLIESAELMQAYEAGRWSPYGDAELLALLVECLRRVPRYCRLTRVIRDIPSHDILAGNKSTNLRQRATEAAEALGVRAVDIRTREIRGVSVDPLSLELRETRYATAIGEEVFLELVTPADRLVAFLRLSLPRAVSFIPEIAGQAMIREVHVYGVQVGLGERDQTKSQHLGLGRRLIDRAAELAEAAGFSALAVISAVGTRAYYRGLGFADGALYQARGLRPA